MKQLNISALIKAQRAFVAARNWERFHTPKNLSMGLVGEAAELMEIFQWLSPAESLKVMKDRKRATAVEHELADILFYLLRLADTLDVDLETAFWDKMLHNEAKYPVEPAKRSTEEHKEFLASKGLHSRPRYRKPRT